MMIKTLHHNFFYKVLKTVFLVIRLLLMKTVYSKVYFFFIRTSTIFTTFPFRMLLECYLSYRIKCSYFVHTKFIFVGFFSFFTFYLFCYYLSLKVFFSNLFLFYTSNIGVLMRMFLIKKFELAFWVSL